VVINDRIMNSRRLFVACCAAHVAIAVAFAVRTDIVPALKAQFGFTDTEMGQILGAGLWGFALTLIVGGLLLDKLGMGKLLVGAFVCHVAGTLLTVGGYDFLSLLLGALFMGLAQGVIEAVANPLVATLHGESRTKHLNLLHAWWPAGLIIGGLMAFGVTKILHLDGAGISNETARLGWKLKVCLPLIPVFAYGFLFFRQDFPQSERVTLGVSDSEMMKVLFRPGFQFLLFVMLLTTATEVGPDQWVGNLLQNLVGMQGVLILVYTAGVMFVCRQFLPGALTRILTPIGLLTCSAVLCTLSLFGLSFATSGAAVFGAATVFGIGKSFFWPTMLGIASERHPEGGAFALGLMGGCGIISAGFLMVPLMGVIQDHYAVAKMSEVGSSTLQKIRKDGASGLDGRKVATLTDPNELRAVNVAKSYSAAMTYRWIATVPASLVLILASFFFYLRITGGHGSFKALTVEIRR